MSKFIKIPITLNIPKEYLVNDELPALNLYPWGEGTTEQPEPELPKPEEPRPEPPTPPQPEPPRPEEPRRTTVSLETKLLNASWSNPKEVFTFSEDASGGTFSTSYEGGIYYQFQQDRNGGKIRIFTSKTGDQVDWSSKKNSHVVDFQGNSVDAHLQDVKVYGGKAYATFLKDKELYLAEAELDSDNDGEVDGRVIFRFVNHIQFEGAKDTSHGLIRFDGKWFVYGRKRAVDWNTQDPILKDRRGVRILSGGNFRGKFTEHAPLDPAETQPGYKKNQFKHDYYATRVGEVQGELVYGISVFQKNNQRPPSTRPDRITGTGPIIPILGFSGNGRDLTVPSHTETPVPLKQHARTTDWKEARPYEPEVGQVYCYGVVSDGRTVKFYYNHRWDTHYLVKPSDPRPNVKVYMIEAEI